MNRDRVVLPRQILAGRSDAVALVSERIRVRRSLGRVVTVAITVASAGCSEPSAPLERRIVAHRIPGCEVDRTRTLLFTALGDFGTAHAASVAGPTTAGELDLPFELLGVEVASLPAGSLGIGYADPPGDVHLTMWSAAAACDCTTTLVPPSHGGQAMVAFADGALVLVAGLEPRAPTDFPSAAFALVWDTRTGAEIAIRGLYPRAWATATSFGAGALLAGGVDPTPPGEPVESALVFREGAFQPALVPLGAARARHGATVLANGETLLVGGEGTRSLLSSLVAIAPSEGPELGRARVFGLGTLAKPRKLPTVLRLANDEILVAGGLDENDQPVSTLEWFAADGSPCRAPSCLHAPQELVAKRHRAFVALPSGGALAVGGVDPATGELAHDAWWITPEGVVEPIAPLTPFQRGTSAIVRLVPAADGAPWLFNGEAWFRFDPWQAAFVVPPDAPEGGPDEDMPSPIAVDPGLFLWLTRDEPGQRESPAKLRGFRHGVRGRLSSDTEFFLADPRHMVPDRRPGSADLYVDAEGLHLSKDVRVAISDATYGDVTVVGETPASHSPLPSLWFGLTDIGRHCSWPTPIGKTFLVRRRGANVEIVVDNGPAKTCSGPSGRVSLALGGFGGVSVTVRKLSVKRTF